MRDIEIFRNYKLKPMLRWWHALLGVVIFFGVAMAMMVVAGMFSTGDEAQIRQVTAVVALLQPLLMFVVALIVIRLTRGRNNFAEAAGLVKPTRRELLCGVGWRRTIRGSKFTKTALMS